jgi:hypothetical protein
LHRQIAIALVELRADAVERNPELAAHHLQEAGEWGGALEHWQKAGAAWRSPGSAQMDRLAVMFCAMKGAQLSSAPQ